MNGNELKSLLVLKGITINELLSRLKHRQKIEMCRSAFYRKMNGISEFNRKEIIAISKELELSQSKMLDVFFNEKVS